MQNTVTTSNTKTASERGSVWYGTRADPLLAMKPLLRFRAPGETTSEILEPRGTSTVAPESVVDAVLEAAGFGGRSGSPSSLALLDDARQFVPHYGFSVTSERWEAVRSALRRFLSGSLGGWSNVLMGQTGFHAPANMTHVFGALWAEAGRPPVTVAHNLGTKPHKDGDERVAPATLLGFFRSDRRSDLLFERFGKLEPGQHDLLTDQKTYRTVQEQVDIAEEACEFCGGRLYEHQGYYFCANAAEITSTPDLEHE
jgi:hypothetical protein